VQTLARLCREKDAFLLPGSPLEGADVTADGIELRTPAESITARSVVNAAGLYADDVSAMLGGREFQIYPCRGEYAELVPAKRDLVNGLIYPLPHTHGLGVHVTKTVAGNVTLGRRRSTRIGKTTTKATVFRSRTFSNLRACCFLRSTWRIFGSAAVVIRAKLHPPDVSFSDFMIERERVEPAPNSGRGYRITGADVVPVDCGAGGGAGRGNVSSYAPNSSAATPSPGSASIEGYVLKCRPIM
jgi:hypothetical protein